MSCANKRTTRATFTATAFQAKIMIACQSSLAFSIPLEKIFGFGTKHRVASVDVIMLKGTPNLNDKGYLRVIVYLTRFPTHHREIL